MILSPVMERFVLHWGEMGTRWGVNRSVAQIHALLVLAAEPLDAETIADTLGIARSNVSTSLRELISWKLVSLVHRKGERRDHYLAVTDWWEMVRLIADGRKQREIDPTLSVLRACAVEAQEDGTPLPVAGRIEEALAFLEQVDGWYAEVSRLPDPMLRRLLKAGSAVARFLPEDKDKD
jgi:DNA-binding transcriptional regulator GbsR (MarR family)